MRPKKTIALNVYIGRYTLAIAKRNNSNTVIMYVSTNDHSNSFRKRERENRRAIKSVGKSSTSDFKMKGL